MSRIVITDCDHPSVDIERAVFARAGHAVALARCGTAGDVIAAGAGAVALLDQYAPITSAVMDALPAVRVVGRYGVSLDTIDLPAAAERGIAVVNVPDYCVDEVADDVIAAGAGAVALLDQYAPITSAVMDALPAVRVVGRYGVSLDTIDLPAAAERGIAVVNVPDYCVDEVADHAVGLILALTRGIVPLDRAVRAGTWDFRRGGELRRGSGLTVGLVGLGRIGSAVAGRMLAMRHRVIATDPRHPDIPGVALVELDALLATSDVVSVHSWLDPTTRHLLDAAAIARMKPGAFLVNTARGALVDQPALVDALRSGHLGGAALDVLEREPIAPDDPLIGLPNVVLTPHAAFYSRESLVEMKTRVAEGIVSALAALDPRG